MLKRNQNENKEQVFFLSFFVVVVLLHFILYNCVLSLMCVYVCRDELWIKSITFNTFHIVLSFQMGGFILLDFFLATSSNMKEKHKTGYVLLLNDKSVFIGYGWPFFSIIILFFLVHFIYIMIMVKQLFNGLIIFIDCKRKFYPIRCNFRCILLRERYFPFVSLDFLVLILN